MSFERFPVVATIHIGRLVPAMARPIQISVLLGKKKLFDNDCLFIELSVFVGKGKPVFSQQSRELVSLAYNHGVESGI